MPTNPTLHLLCGQVASGKSTLAKSLTESEGAVLIQEDAWLASLFGEDMATLQDFVRYSAKLRKVMEPHIVELLQTGNSVVLDFQANTVESRQWMRRLVDHSGCYHQLHVLDVPDNVCKERLKARNASGDHEFQVSEEQFDRISGYFQRPGEDEGFNLVVHQAD